MNGVYIMGNHCLLHGNKMKKPSIWPWVQIARLKKRVAALENALDPNETKGEYIGEIKQTEEIWNNEYEMTFPHEFTIDWTTTKAIMNMIRDRANRLTNENI